MIPYLPPHPNTSPRLRAHPPFDDRTRRRRTVAVRIGLTSVTVAAALAATAGQADAASSVKLSGGTLTVKGDGNANAVALSASADTVFVDIGDDGTSEHSFKRSKVTHISVKAGGGDDRIRIDDSRGAFTDTVPTTIEGEAGADTLTGGFGAETIGGGSGDDTLFAKGGQDVVSGGDGADSITGGDGDDVSLSGGDDDDVFVWNPGDDSDVPEGGAGSDRLKVNGGGGSETFTVAPDGARVRVDRSTPAPFTQSLGSVEAVDLAANGGDDWITGSTGLAGRIHFTADGGTGNDTITGTDGADVLSAGEGSDLVSPARGDDVADLGPGEDIAGWNPGDGDDTIEGGDNRDLLRFDGSADADEIAVSAGGIRLQVTREADGATVDAGTMEDVNVATGGGADSVSYAGTDGDDWIDVFGANGKATVVGLPVMVTVEGDTSDHLTVDTATGQDRINAGNLASTSLALVAEGGDGADELFGGQGADVFFGGAGDDFVDGNQGADVALMGTEDDRFQWSPGDGSDVIEGQAGADALSVFGSNIGETIGLKANGSRLLLTRDISSVTLDAAAVESVDYRALGGADRIFVGDLTDTAVRSAGIDLTGPNGGGDGAGDVVVTDGTAAADVVDVSTSGASVQVAGLAARTAISGSEAAYDRLVVQTLGGDDDVTVDPGVAGLIMPEVDLGADG